MRRDYVTTFITEALVVAGYLLAFKLVADHLGASGFGEYALARRTLSLLLPLGVVGLDIGITRYVSYASAERSPSSAGYVPAGLILMAVAVAILSAVLLVFNGFWAQVFFGSETYATTIISIPPLLAGGSLHVAAYGYLRGLAKIQKANVLMAVNHVIVPVLSIVLFGNSVSGILVAMGVAWTVVSLVPLARLPLTTAHLRERIRELARFGIPRVPGDVVQLLLFAMPGILVAHAADIRVAGLVAFGVAAVSMIGSALTPVSFVLLPFAARLFASGSVRQLRREIIEVVGITMAGTLVLVVLLEVFAGPIVRIYLGPSFSSGVDTLRLTLFGALPWAVYISLRSVIDARHVRPINALNMVISFAAFVVLAVVLRHVTDDTTAAVLAFVLSLYLLAILTIVEVNRIADIAGRPIERRPVVLARYSMLAALPVAVLVSSPQRVTLSALIAAAYVLVAVFSFKWTRANRFMLAYVGAAAIWMTISWLRAKYLLHLTPDQLNYGTAKFVYFTFIVLPIAAAVSMMIDRAEDSWPAIGSQLMFGVGIGLVTVALLGDRILGYDRYQWQGNLIALATVIAIQPWLIKNFWASAAIGVLGVAGMMFADARQSLAAFLLVLFVTAFYWAAAKYVELKPETPNRLWKAISGRYIALPLALVLVTAGAIAFTYNPNKLCHCVTDRIIALQSGPGDRDTLLLRGLTMVEQNPILGAGPGAFSGVVADSENKGNYYQYPHNVPLEIAAETGLVGFVLLIVPLLLTWLALVRTGIQRASPAIASLIMVVAVFFIVANISGDIPSDRGMWIFGIVALKLGIDAWQTRTAQVTHARKESPEPAPVS